MALGTALITIDGSYGEGGGALLRTALAMSAVTQQAVRVSNVRGGTKYPGLDIEDVTVLRALAASCEAETVGTDMGSEAFTFIPTRRARGYKGRLEGQRSESGRGPNALVVLNALLPVMARSGVYSTIVADGETYGMNALSFDAFANLTLPALRRFGLYAVAELGEAGFGRESKGEVSLDIEPSVLHGVEWQERGRMVGIRAIVTTSGLPSAVGERGVSHLKRLAQNVSMPMEAEHQEVGARGPGCFVTVWAVYERGMGGGAAMGARGLKIETLCQAAFEETLEWVHSNTTVDPYLADQILLPAVLAEGPTAFKVSRLTQRFMTTAWVIKQFTPIHITIRGSEGAPGAVTIQR
jgi:RNA 3'-terminal phosphate cyclase (ATP)